MSEKEKQMLELKTAEGELLKFETQEEMIEYVISRMVENGKIIPNRNETGEMVFRRGPS